MVLSFVQKLSSFALLGACLGALPCVALGQSEPSLPGASDAPAAPAAPDASQPHEEDGSYGASAVIEKPVPATNREDVTASGTYLSLQDRPRALETVGEALREVPGTRVRQLGGFGSFSGLSLRGAEAAQTTVLLGNLPLSTVDEGAFDFSLLPPELLEGLVVYRGGAPAFLGEGSMGGVVQLMPKSASASTLEGRAGYGSFDRYQLAGSIGHKGEDPRSAAFMAHVSLDGADNDFPYRHTGGELVQGDETERTVRNAQLMQGTGLGHLVVPLGKGQLEAVVLGLGRSAGIPGPQKAPSPHAHRQLIRLQGSIGYTVERKESQQRTHRLQLLLGAGHQALRVSDSLAEIGTTYPSESDDRWTHVMGRAAGSLALLPYLEGTVVISGRMDTYRPDNPLAVSAPPRDSQRIQETLTGELRLHGDLLSMPSEVRASARGQWNQSQLRSIRLASEPGQATNDFAPTLRVAAAITPFHFLTLSGSVASGVRLPSMLELFGDRAFLLENPELLPERSLSADVGLVAMTQADDFCFRTELRAFHLAVDDLVRYVRTARMTARAENLSHGTVRGLELGADAAFGRNLSLNASMTAMDSAGPAGYPLPFRAPLVLHAQAATHVFPGHDIDRVTLYADIDVVSYNYTDGNGQGVIPGRQWLGLGASIALLSNVDIQVRANNLFDQESKDLNGFWLPRRTLFASLRVRETL